MADSKNVTLKMGDILDLKMVDKYNYLFEGFSELVIHLNVEIHTKIGTVSLY